MKTDLDRYLGQINRHKNQQTNPAGAPAAPQYHHYARHRAHPYHRGAPRGRARGGRGGYAHQHRTPQLNASTATAQGANENGSGSNSSQWVSRNDRHRQLINADVYEKDSQNRARAIEATRAQKEKDWRQGEKQRFRAYLTQQEGASGSTANVSASGAKNELVIEGIRFYVMPGGKKLVKVPGSTFLKQQTQIPSSRSTEGANALAPTPKTAVVSGVKFFRTKTGSLVVNRVIQQHRYVSMPCAKCILIFSVALVSRRLAKNARSSLLLVIPTPSPGLGLDSSQL